MMLCNETLHYTRISGKLVYCNLVDYCTTLVLVMTISSGSGQGHCKHRLSLPKNLMKKCNKTVPSFGGLSSFWPEKSITPGRAACEKLA